MAGKRLVAGRSAGFYGEDDHLIVLEDVYQVERVVERRMNIMNTKILSLYKIDYLNESNS